MIQVYVKLIRTSLKLAVLIGIFFVGAQTALAGFGITPPYVRSDTLTRGSVYTQEIILVRSDPVEDLKGEVTLNTPGIESWIEIDKGFDFVLPKDQTQYPIRITVRVPDDAPFEEYTGSMRIRTSSLAGPGSGVSIALGAQVDVDLKVVDQIEDFKINRVELSELEEGFKKWWLNYPGRVSFHMHLENTGNVPVAPTKVTFDIYDRTGETLLESVENTNKMQKVEPFDTQKIVAYLPTQLKAGRYTARFKIFKGDEPIKAGELNLSILPEGLVPGYMQYGFEGLPLKDKLTVIVPPIAFAVFIILLILLRVFLKRRKKRKGLTRQERRQVQRTVEGTAATPVRQVTARQQVSAPVQQPTRQAGPAKPAGVIDLSRKK